MRKPCRHGDVVLVPVESLPSGAKDLGHKTVAEGEITGHAHRLTTGTLYEVAGKRYVDAGESDVITHEEHGNAPLSGLYHAFIQREHDDEEEWREVRD